MRVILTGASGLAGSAIARAAARRGHHLTGLRRTWREPVPGVHDLRHADLADLDALTSLVLDVFPDAIVHTAAVTEHHLCEADPAAARAINVDASRRLAELAHHVGARFVHLSTDMVFDGASAPYAADAAPSPRSLYGRLKAEAEAAVRAACPETAVIIRPPLLTGNSLSGGRSLHERLLDAWAGGRAADLFTDETRSPCGADNLAELVVELLERPDVRGLLHWAGTDRLTRAAMGHRLAAHFRLPPAAAPIREVRAADDPRFADRPRDLSLVPGPGLDLLKTRPESFDRQLARLVVPAPVRAWYHALPAAAPAS